MDVRDIWGRVQLTIVAILCGIGGVKLALLVATRIRMNGTGAQRDLFIFASAIVGFLVCGAMGGIAYEVLRRRGTKIPRAIARNARRLT